MKMYNLNSRLVSKKYLKLLIKFLKYRNIFDIYNKIYQSTIINDKRLFKYIQNLQRKQIMIKNKAEKMKEYNKKEFDVHTIEFVEVDIENLDKQLGI